jgi:hypothetical protein
MLMLNCWIEEHWVEWGLSSAHSSRLWKLFTPPLVNIASSVPNTQYKIHEQFYIEATDKSWDKDYSLGVSFIEDLSVKYTKLHSGRGIATWQVVVDGLACTACNTVLFILHSICHGGRVCRWHKYTYMPQTAVYCCNHVHWISANPDMNACILSMQLSISISKSMHETNIGVLHISKSCHLFSLLSLLCLQK